MSSNRTPGNKSTPGPRKAKGAGGQRIPNPETLRAIGTEAALHAADKVELINNTRPKQIKIFKKDLDRLRVIGKGNYRKGFYRMLDLCHDVHLENHELLALKKIGKGNARVGLLMLIDSWQDKE